MITQGQIAPDFSLPATDGGILTLAELRPSPVVLFTYGKDGTPTCTNEVMQFNALLPEFERLGVRVVGMSKDRLAAHQTFRAKMDLSLTLVSDHGGHVMEDWGAFGEKLFFGKMVRGVLRSTFLIAGDGRIARIWAVDRVKDHAAEVLAWVGARQ